MYNNEDYENEEEESKSGSAIKDFYYNNKKLIWILIGIIVIVLLFSLLSKRSSNNKTDGDYKILIYTEEMKDGITSEEIAVLNTERLMVKVTDPKGNEVKRPEITWKSSDEKIITITSSSSGVGRVKAAAIGTATVTATYVASEDVTVSAKIDFSVYDGDPSVPLTYASFQGNAIIITAGNEHALSINYLPKKGYITNKVFTSDDPTIASVDEKGVVSAYKKGKTKINVSVNDGQFTSSITIYVVNEDVSTSIVDMIEKVSFNEELIKIGIGDRIDLRDHYTIEPEGGADKYLKWESDDKSIVTVTDKGTIEGIKEGSTFVTVKSYDGDELAKVQVEVKKEIIEVTGMNVTPSGTIVLNLTSNTSQNVVVTVKPDNADVKTFKFRVDNPSIAYVTDNEGAMTTTVIAIQAGQANLIITSEGNETVTKTIPIIVNSNSEPINPGGNGGGSSGGETDYFSFKSRTATQGNEGFFNNYANQCSASNAAIAPVYIDFIKNNSSVDKIRYCRYKDGEAECNPANGTVYTSQITFNMDGLWWFKASAYNSNGTLLQTKTQCIRVNNGGSSSNFSVTCPTGSINVGESVTIPANAVISSFNVSNTSYVTTTQSIDRKTLYVKAEQAGAGKTVAIYLTSSSGEVKSCLVNINSTSGGGSSVSCTAAGQYKSGNVCRTCEAGYKCPSGTENREPCEIGNYQNQTGQSTCKACNGANEYQNQTGQSSCKTCPSGQHPNASHTGCVNNVVVDCQGSTQSIGWGNISWNWYDGVSGLWSPHTGLQVHLNANSNFNRVYYCLGTSCSTNSIDIIKGIQQSTYFDGVMLTQAVNPAGSSGENHWYYINVNSTTSYTLSVRMGEGGRLNYALGYSNSTIGCDNVQYSSYRFLNS